MTFNVKQYIKERFNSPTIIEAGAAEGYDTLEFGLLFPEGKIYSFEPILEMYEMARNRTKYFKNVTLTHAALSTKNGEAVMHVADRYGQMWGSHSFLTPKIHLENHPAITFKTDEVVKTVVLDDFIKDNGISHIDFMWLDMQGHESTMLQASPIALSMTQYIYSEVSLVELYEGTMLYDDYRKFLSEFGFYPEVTDIEWVDGGNVLFKKQGRYIGDLIES